MKSELKARDFRESFPEWKRKKDSFLLRYFYRPISFYGASVANRLGLTSNQVSFLSLIVAVLACALFLFDNLIIKMIGSVLVVVWMIMDCVDGNLARTVKSYPYGDFIDAISSYTLIALLFPCLGVSVFNSGGVMIEPKSLILVFVGCMTGMFDALARLYYQKYLNNRSVYVEKKEIEEEKNGKLSKLNDRVGKEIGLNGLLIPFLIVATAINAIDVFIIVYFCFYGLRFLISFLVLIRKTKCLKK